mmetsp:Transcript_16068/g.35982  ORF Transcript_16068/g.35982 Transcript_16068/m.35982 type:complete len:307 (+) Transcript_16068:57-977(+)
MESQLGLTVLELVLERLVDYLEVPTLVQLDGAGRETIHDGLKQRQVWGRTLSARLRHCVTLPAELTVDPDSVSAIRGLYKALDGVRCLNSLKCSLHMSDAATIARTASHVQRLRNKAKAHLENNGKLAAVSLGNLRFDELRVSFAICERDEGQCSSEPVGLPELLLPRQGNPPELQYLVATFSRGSLYLTLMAASEVFATTGFSDSEDEELESDATPFASYIVDLQCLDPVVPMRATDVWLKGPGYPGYPGKNSLLVPDHAKAVQAMAAGLPCVILVREWHPRVFTDRESVRQLDSLSLDTVRWRR